MTRGLNRMLATGLVVFVAGIVRDVQWHATHDTQKQFENASRQVEVHSLLWLGAALLLVCGWVAARRSATATSRAPLAIFIGALAYGLLSVWHFIEHANGNDPQLAHLLL